LLKVTHLSFGIFWAISESTELEEYKLRGKRTSVAYLRCQDKIGGEIERLVY